MKSDESSVASAVVCAKDGPHAAAMSDFLRSHDMTKVEWFAPRDVDEVDQAVCAGRVRQVVFPNMSGLFDAIWDEDIRFDRWLSAGVDVLFVDLPPANATATAVFTSWRTWSQRYRRRRTIAGAVLSIIALVAGFVLSLTLV